MFTGIVKEIGVVKNLKYKGESIYFDIFAPKIFSELNMGSSVLVSGACLTVVDLKEGVFTAQAMKETLERTNLSRLRINSKVNLEPSLKANGLIEGHIVLGHIDTVVKVKDLRKFEDYAVMKLELPVEFRTMVAEKGSVALDGVSLTVVNVDSFSFYVALIKYTLENTTLGTMKIGDILNFEVDIIARYISVFLKNQKKFLTG